MTQHRATSADYVTAFATGWPEGQPDLMVLSLTTNKGVQDFAMTKEQALMVFATNKACSLVIAKLLHTLLVSATGP